MIKGTIANNESCKFEINGQWYETDTETIKVMRSLVPAARATGDASAVIAVMALGEQSGRIRRATPDVETVFAINNQRSA